jgi:molybdopterin-guanine dinucleotide biosynthesis protein A
MVRPIGVLLAGGASSRMGTDKALVELAGQPMSTWVLQALSTVCDHVVVAGRPDGLGGVRGIADTMTGRRGPLAGLVAVLETESAPVLVVATDQPWVRVETLGHLVYLAGDLPVVPVAHDGTRQTTCAVYPPGILSVALDELLAGGSIQSVLDRTAFDPVDEDTWRSWGEDGRSWFSADSAAAVVLGLERYGPPR